MSGLKCRTTVFGRGFAPSPHLGTYSAPSDPLAGGEGVCCPSPRTPLPLSAFQALDFSPLGLAISPQCFLAPPVSFFYKYA